MPYPNLPSSSLPMATRRRRVILSFAASKLPFISGLAEGTRTIILTVIIAGAAAVFFPKKDEEEEEKNG